VTRRDAPSAKSVFCRPHVEAGYQLVGVGESLASAPLSSGDMAGLVNYSAVLQDADGSNLRFVANEHKFQTWGAGHSTGSGLSGVLADTSNTTVMTIRGGGMEVGQHTEYARYISYASNVLPPSADGLINGVNITALNKRTRTSYASAVDCVRTWTARVSASSNQWYSVCWASELSLFVAVATSGTGTRVMTSSDGIVWTTRTSAADIGWESVCWASELSLFVAVAQSGTGNRVMTSSDGVTWTARTSAADNSWRSVCWAPELSLFVAVASNGTNNRVMTSPNGITWTTRVSAADNDWFSVCWAPELLLFVAVSQTGVGNNVMTSSNGITWTARESAADNNWRAVCWAPELLLFVAVAESGVGNRVMTSSDGVTWTTRTPAVDNPWHSVCWAPELSLFVAVTYGGTGNRVMTSSDGITWRTRTSAADNSWTSVCWAPELSLFVAVAESGTTSNRVMTSAIGMPNAKSVVKALPSQMMVDAYGNVGIGTTNPQASLHVNGVIKALIPAFLVSMSISGGNVTGAQVPSSGTAYYTFGSGATLPWNKKRFDTLNNFNVSNNSFTVPVKGLYHLNFNVFLESGAIQVSLAKGGVPWVILEDHWAIVNSTTPIGSILVELNQNEVLTLYARSVSGTIRVYGPHSYWSMFLVTAT